MGIDVVRIGKGAEPVGGPPQPVADGRGEVAGSKDEPVGVFPGRARMGIGPNRVSAAELACELVESGCVDGRLAQGCAASEGA
ncbi:hypothetical protein ABIA33_000437 [Streptacidiphilus sp. MAP12-16]|uniref:hypothetical protein n=1 Tax=Streptacidiphilus sp. MAP12-16 TaxID=3156300 RepID=UPI0035166D81